MYEGVGSVSLMGGEFSTLLVSIIDGNWAVRYTSDRWCWNLSSLLACFDHSGH
jgi:hypothetical protein